MQEAGASYRAWTPIVAAPWLFRDTMARAAEPWGPSGTTSSSGAARASVPPASRVGLPRGRAVRARNHPSPPRSQ